ncbi:MAG: insulinase family protein [Candidatus Aminicenantes bacterium]|nr:insulinase family protein [Candidatus Aminicenantes bacterium]NIM78086.1 insulinase family protein [Candidatus Aminicenantes bacterium]NIN17404.1 insulinase family protein [Candidatus Aminicenantes bacterium]NIN41300.1 insulinase family protein [Candidatus Aminicenantes bacterium]NIN84070.1 insulinase family protein [Candidatus Aminicenantes bacterium]
MTRTKLTMMALILIFITTLISAQTKVEDIQTFTLKNGMKFIVLEDHSIPNANMFIFFKVGSRNEYPGITGLSHFFEHMMFNGAKKYGPKMFDRVMEAAGGANNAYTNENVTVYTDFFPSSTLEVIFELEADRIGHLALDDKMVESERSVVLSERITGIENSNYRLLNEQVRAVAFMAHPYRWAVMGYESDIKNWKKSDLQRYYDIYYAPNNALVVITGDVKLENIKALAQTYFEPIPSREPPRPIHTLEPEQLGEKRLVVNKDVSSPNLLIVYHVPETGSKDYYALDILNAILSDGRSSRLYHSLVNEKQLALRISSYMPLALDPTLFYISAVCTRGVDEETLEKAIYQEIGKIINEGVSERELQKVKNRKLVNFYRIMERIDGKANFIGIYEIYFGSYKKLFNAPEEYKKVTTDDIKAAAVKYFKKSNRTVGILKKIEEK